MNCSKSVQEVLQKSLLLKNSAKVKKYAGYVKTFLKEYSFILYSG